MWRTTERSWLDEDEREAGSGAAGPSSRLMICDWIDTSSAEHRLVADDQLRVQHHRPGDADALALGRRRIRADKRLIISGINPTRRIISRTSARRSAFDILRAEGLSSGSATMSPNGHPRVEGRERVLEDDLHVLCAGRGSRRPSRRSGPAPSRPRARRSAGSSCRMARPRVDLPQPLSPTTPSVSPAARSKLMPSTAFNRSRCRLNSDRRGHREVHLDVADAQDRRARPPAGRRRGCRS